MPTETPRFQRLEPIHDTAAALARRTGFDKSTLSLWLRGLSRPSRLAREKLRALGIELVLPPFTGRPPKRRRKGRR